MRYWIKLISIPSMMFLTLAIAGYLFFGRTVLHIDHPVCFGSCPTYTVWVFHNGTVLYYGDQFVAHRGPRIGYMEPAQVQEFAAMYTTLIDQLPPIPPSDMIITDMPARSIALTQHGQTRRITIEATDGPRVPLVNAFIDQLETAAHIPYWTRGTIPTPASRE